MSRVRPLADEPTTQSATKKNDGWQLEPHVCKKCFARLVSRPVADAVTTGLREFACTNCGLQGEAVSSDAVCCCGIKIRRPGRGGKAGALVDAGVRCIPNPEPSLQFPSLYVASEVAKR